MKKSVQISADRIACLIRDFIDTSSGNTMQGKTVEPAWDSALVEFDQNDV